MERYTSSKESSSPCESIPLIDRSLSSAASLRVDARTITVEALGETFVARNAHRPLKAHDWLVDGRTLLESKFREHAGELTQELNDFATERLGQLLRLQEWRRNHPHESYLEWRERIDSEIETDNAEEAARKRARKQAQRKKFPYPGKKPSFVRNLGGLSWLDWRNLMRLRGAVDQAIENIPFTNWRKVKEAAMRALADFAEEEYEFDCKFHREGGDVCFYDEYGQPVFALFVGGYFQHGVERLLRGKALYRAVVTIQRSGKVLYLPVATVVGRKKHRTESRDLAHLFGWIKEHGGFSRHQLEAALRFSPRKAIRLLDILRRRKLIYHRGGHSPKSAWYAHRVLE